MAGGAVKPSAGVAVERFAIETLYGVEQGETPPRRSLSGITAIHLRRIAAASGAQPAGQNTGPGWKIPSVAECSRLTEGMRFPRKMAGTGYKTRTTPLLPGRCPCLQAVVSLPGGG